MSFKFDLIKLTFFALALIASHEARAQDVDNGAFNSGNAGAAPNQDSDSVPGLSMAAPVYSGIGCPAGSVSATLSPDQKELSMLFDAYLVRAGGATNQQNSTANCQVKMNFNVPAGYQAQIVKIDYRGFESVPAGAGARISTTFGYEEWNGHAMPMRKCARWTNFTGPSQQNFMLSSIIQGPPASPCGQSFTLTAESMVQVVTNAGREETLMSVDSLDAVALPVKLSLRWKKCDASGGPGGPGRPGGPGGPFGPGGPGGPGRPGGPGGPFGPGGPGGPFGPGGPRGPGGHPEPPRPPPPPPPPPPPRPFPPGRGPVIPIPGQPGAPAPGCGVRGVICR